MTNGPILNSTFPSWNEVLQVLTFNGGYNTSLVIAGTMILGIASGCVGCFALLRKRTLMSDALSHCALPGLAAAFLVSSILFEQSQKSLLVLLAGAAVSGVLGIIAVQLILGHSRLREDAAIGIVLSVFFGAGVALMSLVQTLGTGNASGLNHFIYGQTAALTKFDVTLMFWVGGILILICLLLLKEFRLLCFDPDFGAVSGYPMAKLDFLLMTLVTATTLIGLQAVGIILVIAMLSIPSAAARFWSDKLSHVLIISCLIGGLSGYLGAALSALLPNYPTGAVIVLVAGALFFVSMLIAPARGLLAEQLRNWKTRQQVLTEHALRGAFEYLDAQRADAAYESTALNAKAVPGLEGLPWLFRKTFLLRLKLQKLIQPAEKGSFFLTVKGVAKGRALTLNHRLWEEYISTFGTVDIAHVDYSADLVEHALSPHLVEQLKQRVYQKSEIRDLPASLHPLSERDEPVHPTRRPGGANGSAISTLRGLSTVKTQDQASEDSEGKQK